MTSRPPLAVSQRQPQRSHSGPGLSQRPVTQRSLSQQYLPQSPIRNELTPDVGDAMQGRYGTNPRRGGSKLKLELANDGIEHEGFSESPQNLDPLSANRAFTPSRMMPMQESSDLGDASPHTPRCPTADNYSAPMPMPVQRTRFVVPPAQARPVTTPAPAPARKDLKPKPFVLETPPAAPRYSNMGRPEAMGYGDFYPWTGDQIEDRFTDPAIRNGYVDKPLASSQTELASAKGPLFSSLKHKGGLHSLSTLFTSILNQRRHNGQITAVSTFKPPPRVTLTDTKREVWLKDLANPAISLRRLSRTIPHGIRGRVLLDQCLNKNIPIERALWLAKCVGANEIRAFKRKGVTNFSLVNEAKWIRDWTSSIEQWVEAVSCDFSVDDWKNKVTYAIRLATHLYSEHLVERDHYMDWLVSGLENSTQARLPMWILIIKIYWKDLLRLRRTGRRLVNAILSHHAAIYQHPDRDILQPLVTQLFPLVDSLILNNPESFVFPQTWSKYRDVLLSYVSSATTMTSQRAAFETIDRRNDQLSRTHIRSQPAVRGILVKLLDATLRMPFKDDLATQAWKVSEDKFNLIKTVLEWSTSFHRPGIAKVYVAASMLGSFAAHDADVTRAILRFLDTDPLQEPERKHLTYHLVSELIRASHFSVPRYLQWLIARGGLGDYSEAEPDGPCSTRLLVELPVQALNQELRNLRSSILRRVGFSVEAEASDIATGIKCVKRALGLQLDMNDPIAHKKPLSIAKLSHRIKVSSHALQADVSSWLCQAYVAGFVPSLKAGKGGDVVLSSLKFDSVRALLEASQDYTMLENVLRMLVLSSSAELLASCADTVNLHIQIFAATGSAKPLFQALLDRLKAISDEQGIGARPLLASLASLAPRIPGLEAMAEQLQRDLVKTDRSSAVDASSPLSDNMASQLQDDEAGLNEQIEKLASYSSADRPTMERLFQAISHRLQSCWGKADERQRPYCLLLTRLRVFDAQYFDSLMRGWVQHIRKLTNRPAIAQMFPLLMSSGCLSLAILFSTAARAAQSQAVAVKCASVYMQEVLQMLMMPVSPDLIMTSEDCYRFRIIQDRACLEHAKEVMPLVRGALAEYSASQNQEAPKPLDDEKTQALFLELLRSLILLDPNAVCQTLSVKSPDPKLATLIENVTTQLLGPSAGGGHKTFEQVLELANEFTLPFCQIKLSLNLSTDGPGTGGSEKLQNQLVLLSKAMDNAIDANNIMWTGMISSLSPEITLHMKSRAEVRFLDLMPSPKSMEVSEEDHEKSLDMAENLLAVIDSIVRGAATPNKSPQVSTAMVDKLADLWDIVASNNPDQSLLQAATVAHWLPLLLSYVTLHASPTNAAAAAAADASKQLGGGETRARAILVLAGLVQELDRFGPTTTPMMTTRSSSSSGSGCGGLAERAFDLALTLADNLGDEARLPCVRAVREATADPRMRYLFSFAARPAENLMLSHRLESSKPAGGPGGRGSSTPGGGGGGGGFKGGMLPERLSPFHLNKWEILNEPTAIMGENDTSLSLHLFDARKL